MLKKINIILSVLTLLIALAGAGIFHWVKLENQKPTSLNSTKQNKIQTQEIQPAKENKEFSLDSLKEKFKEFLGQEGQAVADPDKAKAERDIFSSPLASKQADNQGSNFTFAVVADSEDYSDTGYNSELEPILAKVKEKNPTLVFFTGDILSTSAATIGENRQRITNIKNLIAKYITQKFYIVFGKHDIECGLECIDAWQEIFFNKKYQPGEKRSLTHSFDFENTHFTILSSEYPLKHGIDDEQLSWLDQDLAKSNKTHKIVFVHSPPITFFEESAKACHDMSCDQPRQAKLQEIFKKHKVDLVVSGHEHVFDHKIVDGIDYVLAGNSGNGQRYKNTIKGDSYSLVTVNKGKITLKALTPADKELREIEIK